MEAGHVSTTRPDAGPSETPGHAWTRRLLTCGAVAGPLFVSVFLVEGARRPDYNPRRHPVSALSLGPRGWVQIANFALAGKLCLAGALGLARVADAGVGARVVPALLGAAGLGLLGSAAFPTDPVGGYPPGTPPVPSAPTTMRRHTVSALPIFLGLPAAALVHAWGAQRAHSPRSAAYSAATATVALTSMFMAGAGFDQRPPLARLAGLLQRVAIVALFAWTTALLTQARRRQAGPRRP